MAAAQRGEARPVKIVECPRDAMQGIGPWIPTETKAAYINGLLGVGFDTVDFGSFVSPKAVPQMKDSAEVLKRLNRPPGSARLLCIVANERGAREAAAYDAVDCLGYPFSISETFQMRNTHATVGQSLTTVRTVRDVCEKSKKELVVYLSMAFGNPYGDPWSVDLAAAWVQTLAGEGVGVISLADTVGLAAAGDVGGLFASLVPAYPGIEFGVHLHCRPDNWKEKADAAFRGGCRRFDSAIRGYGGCPMAGDALVGNLPTENLIQYLEEKGVETGIDKNRFNQAVLAAANVFH
jgi:hydroxymethylglutaryl-CoA lyase